MLVEGYYETAMQDQAALGPEGGLAVPADDGGVDLYVATQWLHVDRQQIAPCLGLPEEKVRLTLAGVGGAFGSREDISIQIHASLLALRTGRPVKMAYGREESFHGHVHRHPSRTWIRYGATADGMLVSADVRLLLDGGAYASSLARGARQRGHVRRRALRGAERADRGDGRLHEQPAVRRDARLRRAAGRFAYESAMDALAAKLGLDPVELRLRNALRTGSVLPTGQVLESTRRCAR